jgi:hypothetical protein
MLGGADLKPHAEPVVHHLDAGNYLQVCNFPILNNIA